MAVDSESPLSTADIDHFVAHGFVKMRSGLDPARMRRWVDESWARVGYDPADPATWKEQRIHLPVTECLSVQQYTPRVYAAVCQLMGGAERIPSNTQWGNGLIVNYGYRAEERWIPPERAAGWHKDGDFFLHFLDSPEQGLLTIMLFDRVESHGGATFLACDSVAHVARFLAEHPEGINPNGQGIGFPFKRFIAQCSDFREAVGEAGDVYLIHPFMLHAASQNFSGRARFIINPPVRFLEPMRFDRGRFEDHCPVERAILRGLGVESFRFVPTSERQQLVPERIARQAKLLEEEKARRLTGQRENPA
jgi:hypothetical protein